MKIDIVLIEKINRKTLDSWWLSMYIKLKDLLVSFCWTNKPTIQVCFDLILYLTTNLHSCFIKTLVNILAEILDSFQSSRDLYIDMTIKEKKLRTVRNYIFIGKPSSIAFKMQAIIRSSIEWITILSPIYFLSIVFGRVFTILSIDHILGLGIVNTTCTIQYILGDFCIEKRIELRIR